MERTRVRIGVGLVASIVAVMAVSAMLAVPVARAAPVQSELVWGNGMLWTLVAPPSPLPMPASSLAQEEFYEAAPQMPSLGTPSSPQSYDCSHLGLVQGATSSIDLGVVTGCAHDHMIPVMQANMGGFTADWHVFVLFCAGPSSGPNSCTTDVVTGTVLGTTLTVSLPLAYSVTLNGKRVPLTSFSAIESAEQAGVIFAFDTHVSFICAIMPAS